MSTRTAEENLVAVAEEARNWTVDPATRAHTLEYGDLEIRVSKGRLNDVWEWGLYNQGQIVLQGQWRESLSDAQLAAVEFARKWMVGDITV